ncbi:hypothetical protein [Bradyrhizobium stylosanthis]|uniref:Lectin-like protein BA14k n=1 Tax=Bradyrhizobium stylosanthis TaxID=1803665 RepID=A0A560DWK6_9BRAD|nr:hypothetical protein [Bradyrhizobium stylosanthis]TWB01500.1 hypothetical protein FBZ96_103275 [Bradyrhizobium stylosanthis]
MTSLKLIGAAAIAVSALAAPAMGQSAITNPAACESMFASANCLNTGAGSPYATSRQQRQNRNAAYRQQSRNDSGFWPVNTAGAVAGAAVGTAAAVASAPFQGWSNSYAYDTSGGYNRGGMGWYGNWDTYAARNGIVCRPGTWYKGADGLRHICQ